MKYENGSSKGSRIRAGILADQNCGTSILFPPQRACSIPKLPWISPELTRCAAKSRFLRQDSFGLDVSVFPRVFLPSGWTNIGNNAASLLLPVWVQKDWSGGWSAFGGGGCVISGHASQNFCLTGGVVTYQLLPKLQLGAELFHQTADGNGTPASTSVRLGAPYDLDDTYHLLGYIRRGIENTSETDQFSWYASVLFTF